MSMSLYISGKDTEINLCNRNAGLLLNLLDIPMKEGYPQEITVGEFRDRLEHLTLNVLPDDFDNGTATKVMQSEGHATIIDCGLRPGYWTDLFDRLWKATHGKYLNAPMVWC